MATLTPDLIDAALADPANPGAPPSEPSAAPAPTLSSQEQDAAIMEAGARGESPQPFAEPGLKDGNLVDPEAVLGGGLQAVFETKDFLFGEPAAEDKWEARKNVEEGTAAKKAQSIPNSLGAFAGQFSVGMIGAGKVLGVVGLAGKVGKAAQAVEIGKAAAVGAVAFDPYEERLSNQFKGTIAENPLTDWLAAKPEDTAAEGRFKNALESIGVDLATIAVIAGSVRAFRALKGGNAEEIAKATSELEGAKAAQSAPETPKVDEPVDLSVPEDRRDLLGSGYSSKQLLAMSPEQVQDSRAAISIIRKDRIGAATDAPEAGADWALRMDYGNEITADVQAGRVVLPENMPSFVPAQGSGGYNASSETMAAHAADLQEWAKSEGISMSEALGSLDEEIAAGKFFDHGDGSSPPYDRRDLRDYLNAQAIQGDTVAVQGITDAKAKATEDGSQVTAAPRPVEGSPEQMEEVLKGLQADTNAMVAFGDYGRAMENGHVWGRGEGLPWQKFNAPEEIDEYVARVADAYEGRLNTLKGGDVMSDPQVQQGIRQRAVLFGEDPAQLIGMIQESGAAAPRMVADMEAGYLVSHRMLLDTYGLAQRYRLGHHEGYASADEMLMDLRKRVSVAADVLGAAQSIKSNSARSLRRMRSEFALDPKMVADLEGVDGEDLVNILLATQGNPQNLAKVADPSIWSKLLDKTQYLLVNNLVSGPITQVVNITTNLGMMASRPLEKMLGGTVQAVGALVKGDMTAAGRAGSVIKEAYKQYAYTGVSFMEGFGQAWRAFKVNDSILVPHNVEANAVNKGQFTPLPWKAMDTVEGLMHNAMLAVSPKGLWQGVGMPTRILGTVDEVVKQTVYRSKVMAAAHMDGVEQGLAQGLKDKALAGFVDQFVKDKLAKAFDKNGVGLDPVARREAQIATFNQDLLPKTLGKGVQNLVANVPGLKLILPFVRTPTNAIRYGWKLSPGLNLFQTEFRQQIMGAHGPELQAEAVGQMAMGTLYMGAAAYQVSQGRVTGGGPMKYKEREALLATGWRPYSYVSEDANGKKTYTSFGRFDPVAIPLGIIADLQDAMEIMEVDENDKDIGDAIYAVTMALTAQFRNKTYLQNLNATLSALDGGDEGAAPRVGAQMAANMIPYSAALRQMNSDPYLREARTMTDKLMAGVPGLSPTVPAKYDAFGDPILARRGLRVESSADEVDIEMQRMTIENGAGLQRPNPVVQQGVDLRDLTMANGKNAFEEYQKLAGRPTPRTKPLKDVVAKMMASEAYQKAPDGPMDVKGTKLWLLHTPVQKYRDAAMAVLKTDKVVRDALLKRQLKVQQAYTVGPKLEAEAAQGGGGGIGDAFQSFMSGFGQ